MAGILKVYNIGSLGIDLVNSPVHVEDTCLVNSQNAQVSPHDKELGIAKRDGMVKINSSVANGKIKSITNISI